MPDRLYIAVVGGGSCTEQEARQAHEVGAQVAISGAVVVCGGLGGVMEAACRGAREAGGTTVGILPGTKRSDANAYVEVALPTGMGEARNALVVRAADALVAVSGEFGTLSEIALALSTGVPVVGLGTWTLSRKGEELDVPIRAGSPAEAVNLALALAMERQSGRG